MADNFTGNYMESFARNGEASFSTPGLLVSHERLEDGLFLRCDNKAALRITVIENGLIRFRFAPDGLYENDFSYALDETFQPEAPQWDLIEFADGFAIQTATLSVRIIRKGLKVTITHRQSGKILLEDASGFEWMDNHSHGGEVVRMSKKCRANEHFYGLGDKSCELDIRGKRFSLWGSDTYGYGPDTDPLYKNIPFYISILQGRSYGIFFDNSFRTEFDFAHSQHDVTSFMAPGGEMNYYFFHAEAPLEVVALYTRLTGLPELPPLWALGYHQCKWSYYPEAEVRTICDEFRKQQIPCDSIYLDIDYMDGYRCFTWDPERFPDPKQMVSDLEDIGFKTVAMIDPGLKIDDDYAVWRDGYEKGYYCRRMDGPVAKGSVWPGLCHFPDFTRPEVRDWWADLYKELMDDIGLRGIWNDMNEPAVFEDGTMPDDVRFSYEGNPCSHRKAHNVYGMQMVRATQEGLRRHGRGRRPFAITRSCYSGTQRFSSAWTGDNVASWEHLKMANRQCQRLATSGMSFVGSDIGGFIETPTPELYARWVQLGAFHPFFRTHSSGDHGDQEPWSFGEEARDLAKKAIELRYRMLPLHYTAFWQHATTGVPILRSLPLLDHTAPDTYWRDAEFSVGDHLYVIPATHSDADYTDAKTKRTGRTLYLPQGKWFSYWDDSVPEATRKDIWMPLEKDRLPIFVRAGAVLPHWPLQQFVGEIEHPRPELLVWPCEEETTSQWYEDSGDHFFYKDGDFRASTITQTNDGDIYEISRSYEGSWSPAYSEILLTPRAYGEIASLHCDGTALDADSDGNYHLPPDFKQLKITTSA